MITRIRISLDSVQVHDDADFWGAGEWYLDATIDADVPNQRLGDLNYEFEARSGRPLPLGPVRAQWSREVDVSGMARNSSVLIRLRVRELTGGGNRQDLGEVTGRVPWPFNQPNLRIPLDAPLVDGTRHYRAEFLVTIVEEVATRTSGPARVPVRRNAAGDVTRFSTVAGAAFTPRVEVCPVIPVPAHPAHRPPRLPMPGSLTGGIVPAAAQLTAAPAAPRWNAIPNPAVIPILDRADPNLANKQARLTVTYFEPGDLDTSRFHWRVVSGPAVIIGSDKGLGINVRGTGNAADTMAEFEVRWENDAGPLLAKYRAWVGKVGTLPYRVTFLNGKGGHWQCSTIMSSAEANNIMQVVRAIHYQAAVMLVPDADVTGFDGATLFPAGNTNAVFQTTVARNQHTRNVDHDIISRSTRYNFRPGVINFAFVHSTRQTNAAAVDRNGIAGTAGKTQLYKGKLYYGGDAKGSTKDLDGSPSTSWIKPSGVPNDAVGIKWTLKTIDPTDRVNQAKGIDKSYVNARNAAAPPFTAAMMGQLYACHCPVVWCRGNLVATPPNPPAWTQAQYEWNSGINLAHELGHILGLAHRGSGWSPSPPLSADGMDCDDRTLPKAVLKGHPWDENLMTYGYVATTPLAHNIDLIQASVVRAHPAITY